MDLIINQMSITVNRKHSLFRFDHTHAHNVFKDGVYYGEISKHADKWQLKCELSNEPIYVAVNERERNTYAKLSNGIERALMLWSSADYDQRQNMLAIEKIRIPHPNFFKAVRVYETKKVIHVPSGTVFLNISIAAEALGMKQSSLQTYVSKRSRIGKYEYYDPEIHKANIFYNH